jgi:SpoVK/Ycf46/Vps4 family AAA+-type ATPase
MADHLLDHVHPYLDRSLEDRIAYIRAPRWIGHQGARQAHERLTDLLSRPPSLRTRGLMLVGPYANGKTMIAERFAVAHLKTSESQRVWVVQTREGAGLAHFYASILRAFQAPTGTSRDVGRKAEQVDHLLDSLKPRILIFDEFHNAVRGRARDVEAALAFLRRIGRQFDISPVLICDAPPQGRGRDLFLSGAFRNACAHLGLSRSGLCRLAKLDPDVLVQNGGRTLIDVAKATALIAAMPRGPRRPPASTKGRQWV